MTSAATTSVRRPDLRADVGVIGGSGFYSFLSDVASVRVETPFGAPSDDLVVGELGGHTVAFLPRHGKSHRIPPHRINFRANLWALRAVGVRQVLAPCAVGSLDPANGPGTIVVPDQLIDRTWGREHTLYAEEGPVVHVSFADPYCPTGRRIAIDAATAAGLSLADKGTLVVINGPRFSTRAEASWHRQAGGTIVGMTGMPEAVLARELALCFTTMAVVTDLDAGIGPDDAVTHAGVLEAFEAQMPTFKSLVSATIEGLPQEPGDDAATCSCRRALDGIRLPFPLP